MTQSDVTAAATCCAELAQSLSAYWDPMSEWSPDDEARFNEHFGAVPFAVFRVAPEGVVRDCNQGAADLLGYSRHELIGMPIAALHTAAADGRGKASALFGRFKSGERFCGAMVEVKRRDGRPLSVSLCSHSLTDSYGVVREGISVIRDATEDGAASR